MTLTPFDHQITGIDFLIGGGSLLAYDPGLGKTYTALWASEYLPPRLPVLVSAPSSVLGVWVREIQQVGDYRVLLLDNSNTAKSNFYAEWDYILVSMDLPGRNEAIAKLILSRRYAAYISDEAHGLKDPFAKRTQFFLTASHSAAKQSDKVWLLTGTPTPNHAGELFPMIKATKPDFDFDYPKFTNRYCRHKMARRGKREVRVISGTNLARVKELRTSLDGWWLRGKKEDFLDLPPKVRRVVPLYADDLQGDMQALEKTAEGRALALAMEMGDMRMSQIGDDDSMSRFRRLMSEVKAPACTRYVMDLLDGGSRGLLFWFWHRSGMDVAQRMLEEAGHSLIRIDGATPRSKRDGLVEAFQRPNGPKVALLQIKAAGTGITLTKAENEVFAEISWTPSDNLQAEDRAMRIGQDRMVNVDWMAVANSLDMTVIETAERRLSETQQLETRP